MLKSVNPFDQSLIATFEKDDQRAVSEKIGKSAKAFLSWKRKTFPFRGDLMKRAGELLRTNKEHYAKTISQEMGKVLTEARAEIDKCANVCDYYADHAESFLADEHVATDASKSFIAYQPLGPILAVMPWNFPLWQVFRFAAPSLMAGNVGLLKHASNVTQCAMMIEKIFLDADFPEGVFQTMLVGSDAVEAIIARDEIAAVTLTGSEFAGMQVAAHAGKNLKKTVLELGGSDPFIVLDDADLEYATTLAITSRMQNAGQSCIAAKRFIVLEKVSEAFTGLFKQKIEALVQGNPLDPLTTTGPLARLDLAEQLERQLQASLKAGARLVTGGTREGCNFKPTLIDQVTPGMKAFDEEMFGPVAALVTVKDEAEAIRMANQSRYGLGASVWTSDPQRGEFIAREIESGSVFVNSLMRSDQRLPFGGIKKSGYGRELGIPGIREFVNVKTVYIR